MCIESDNSFLSLERVARKGSAIVWRIMAAAAGEGCIAAVHGQARVITTEETPTQIAEFVAHRAQRFDLVLSQGGWLRIKRAPGGHALVRYRVGQSKANLALEGEVRLEAEPAEAFCRELGGLL